MLWIATTLVSIPLTFLPAEFRGPGVHHSFDDSDSGYDVDMDGTSGKGANNSKSFGMGGYRGRIIFLGDGTEVLTDGDDPGMFEQESKDSESRVTDVTDEETDKEKAAVTDDSEMTVSDDKDADTVKKDAAAKESSTPEKIAADGDRGVSASK